MWMRIAGLACLFLGCCLTGVQKERRLKQRWLVLQEFCEVLRFLEKETLRHHTPLAEALENAAIGCRTALREMLLQTSKSLQKRQGRGIREIWAQASLCIPARLLSEEEASALLSAAAALGNADTVMQQTLLGSCEQRMEAFAALAERDWREKGMLYRRLSAAAGVFLLILLA